MILQTESKILQEEDIFDKFDRIFHLHGERVKAGTPLDSVTSHKMAYIIYNNFNFSTKKVKYVSYLHEKKIYLNPIKTNTSYFYTSISSQINEKDEKSLTCIIALNLSDRKMYTYS